MATEILKADNTEQKWSTRLAELRDKITSFLIQTPDDFRMIGELRKQAKSFIEDVGFEKDPIIKSAKEHLDLVKADKAKYVDPANEVIKAADKKMAEYNEKKRLEAEAQTRRENEERRVKAEREAAELKRIADEKAEKERKEKEANAIKSKMS